MDPGILATLVTAGAGITEILVSRFKCLVSCVDCRCQSCKFGFLDNAIVDTHEVEFKRITANGNDLIYVSKNAVNVNDSDDEPHTDVPSDFYKLKNMKSYQLSKQNNILVIDEMPFLVLF